MKITELIELLVKELDDNGDIEVAFPLDTGDYGIVSSASVKPLFLHDAFEPVFSEKPLARQAKYEHDHVLIISTD